MGAPGCDDAPIVAVPRGMFAKRVTMIYPYYDNPDFLTQQIAWWAGWPRDIIERTNLIVVDDCSPETPARDVLELVDHTGVRLFRIEKDVRWNWLAARNIGARHAADGWILLTDMDHVVPSATMHALLYGLHDEKIIYRFSRREHTGNKIHPHPNSWFMTKAMFWKVGGYDERMSGYYGSDSYYRRRCAATAPIRIMTDELIRHEHLGDSSTRRYLRKQPMDARLRPLVRAFKPGSKPRTLSFPYHEVDLSPPAPAGHAGWTGGESFP